MGRRRKGQSKTWGNNIRNMNNGPRESEFEAECRRLHLQPQDYRNSPALRFWAKRNRNRYYVPEDLLHTWGLDVKDSQLWGRLI